MKIYNPNISKQGIGGGWSFRANLEKALKDEVEFVNSWSECDIFLISSLTIVDKGEVHQAFKAGKKIVLRIDNMPRKSRNLRMTPHERLKEYAQMSKAIVYQSIWAKEWIGQSIGYDNKVKIIYNGVDTDIFKPIIKKPIQKFDKVFMYVQYNRDENKRMPEAFDIFTKEYLKHTETNVPFPPMLWIVGRYSPELIEAGFDFWRGESFRYMGVMETPLQMANLMQQADVLLYPSYSDACPNTVIEAVCCGMDVWHHGHAGVGEATLIPDKSLKRMGQEYLSLFKSL